jgi:hypothetical protein
MFTEEIQNALENDQTEVVASAIEATPGDRHAIVMEYFYRAACCGALLVMQMLVERFGAKLYSTGRYSIVMHVCVRSLSCKVAYFLLAQGVDLSIRDIDGLSAFMIACADSIPSMVRLVGEATGWQEINATTPDRTTPESYPAGCTPLWLSCFSALPAIARVLLLHGADPTIANQEGMTINGAAQQGLMDLSPVSPAHVTLMRRMVWSTLTIPTIS